MSAEFSPEQLGTQEIKSSIPPTSARGSERFIKSALFLGSMTLGLFGGAVLGEIGGGLCSGYVTKTSIGCD